MKNISAKILSLMIVMLVALSGLSFVRAEGSSVTLTSSNKLKAGETITINVSLASGFNGFSGEIEYDTSIFEDFDLSGAGTGSQKWNTSIDATNIATVDRGTNTTSTEKVATITLKVKDGVTATSTTVKIKDISESKNGVTVTKGGTAYITFDAEKDTVSGGTAGTADNTPVSNTPVNNTPVNNTPVNNIKGSKTNASRILNAGDATTTVIMAVIAVVAVVGCVGFIKYAKNKDIK